MVKLGKRTTAYSFRLYERRLSAKQSDKGPFLQGSWSRTLRILSVVGKSSAPPFTEKIGRQVFTVKTPDQTKGYQVHGKGIERKHRTAGSGG